MQRIRKSAHVGTTNSTTDRSPKRVWRAAGTAIVASLVVIGAGFVPQVAANAANETVGAAPTSEDAAAFAAASGYTPEQAQRVLDGQEEFSLFLADLKLSSDIYAAGAIAPNGDFDAWIAFTSEPEKATLARIDALSLNTEVHVGATWTARELDTALDEAHEAIEATAGVAGALGWLDSLNQDLEFIVWGDGTAALDLASLEKAGRLAEGSAQVSISVTIAREPAATDEVVGGQPLSNGCTSAFTVKNASNNAGVLSAAHCPNSVSGFTFGGEVQSGSTDAQWHRTTNVENKIRYNSTGSTRTITSYYLPATGGAASFYGSASGAQSSTIYSTNVCWPGLSCGFIAVSGSVTAGGDSGGPWYNGNAALGVHKGTAFVGFANRSVFTPVGNAMSSLGVSLCTASICGLI